MEKGTVVVFRMWKDGSGVIALFPYEHETHYYCRSYAYIGQHGVADYAAVIARTRAAKPEEYEGLKRELESEPYGYELIVRKRANARLRRVA